MLKSKKNYFNVFFYGIVCPTLIVCVQGCHFLKYKLGNFNKNNTELVNASFPGGYDSLVFFIKMHHNRSAYIPDYLNMYNDSFYNQYVDLQIDSLGNIVDKYMGGGWGYEFCEKDIYNIVARMPKFEPGYVYNLKTKQKVFNKSSVSFSLDYYYYKYNQFAHPNTIVEYPSFPGGKSELDKFIWEHRDTMFNIPDSLNGHPYYGDTMKFVYRDRHSPPDTLRFSPSHSVLVSTIINVNADGSISTLRPPDTSQLVNFHDTEIYGIISKMPQWNPAYELNIKTGEKRFFKMPVLLQMEYYYESERPKR